MPDAAAPNALVSVIVPIYNGEAFLADCIESVLGQSYPYLELLLADDGSSDRSAEICAQYALRDARIKFLRLPHSGVSAARNAALAQARGDYFFFLDCDDLLHPEAIGTELRLMQEAGCEIGAPDLYNVPESFRLDAPPAPSDPDYLWLSPETARAIFTDTGDFNAWAIGGKMVSRHAASGISFPEGVPLAEDTLFLIEVLAHTDKPSILLLGKWYYRRIHRNNAIHRRTFAARENYLKSLLRLRERSWELFGTVGCWELRSVSYVFNWYRESEERPGLGHPPDKVRQLLLGLLRDEYAHLIPFKRRFTVCLYLICPSLYQLSKKLFWAIHKLFTGEGDPELHGLLPKPPPSS